VKSPGGCLALLLSVVLLCGASLVFGYVLIVALAIPQLPDWAQPGVSGWLLDIPQDSESRDNGSGDSASTAAGIVGWDGYNGPEAEIYGLPLYGPIQHWSDWHDQPLLGCVFQDPFYTSHTGDDFPVQEGTPAHTPMGGKVVWAGENGPWGNLVVIENNGNQIWLAHLSSLNVSAGQIVRFGAIVGLSGNTGNSTGPHLHYGIKHKTEEDDYVWLNPHRFFSEADYIKIACSD